MMCSDAVVTTAIAALFLFTYLCMTFQMENLSLSFTFLQIYLQICIFFVIFAATK